MALMRLNQYIQGFQRWFVSLLVVTVCESVKANIVHCFKLLQFPNANPSCLHLAFWNVVFRVDFEEMVKNDEDHRCASEKDSECIKLAVCDHIGWRGRARPM